MRVSVAETEQLTRPGALIRLLPPCRHSNDIWCFHQKTKSPSALELFFGAFYDVNSRLYSGFFRQDISLSKLSLLAANNCNPELLNCRLHFEQDAAYLGSFGVV